MYVYKETKNEIIAYMHGYNFGRMEPNSKSSILKTFSSFITEKFNIEYRATGWPGQIDVYSKRNHQSWELSFKRLMFLFLSDYFEELLPEAKEMIRLRMFSSVFQFYGRRKAFGVDSLNEDWITLQFFGHSWFDRIFTKEEILFFKKAIILVEYGDLDKLYKLLEFHQEFKPK